MRATFTGTPPKLSQKVCFPNMQTRFLITFPKMYDATWIEPAHENCETLPCNVNVCVETGARAQKMGSVCKETSDFVRKSRSD